MACNFQGSKCQGMGQACEGASQAVYEVKVTQGQHLCGPCAAEKRHLIVTEKVGQPKWVCKKHDEVVKFYCETHEIEACISCATVRHQRPCNLRDLEDVVADRKSEAAKVIVLAAEKKDKFTKIQEELDFKKSELDKFIASNEHKIKNKSVAERKQIKEKEEQLAIKINNQADEAIKKINDDRIAQLRKLKEVAGRQRDIITQEQDRDLAILARHTNAVHNELQRYGSDLQQKSWSLKENMAKLEMSLKQDNREAVTSMKQAVLAAKESLEKKPVQTSTRLNARCIEGQTMQSLFTRIFGPRCWSTQFDYIFDSEWIKVMPFQQWYNEQWYENNAAIALKKVVDEHRDSIGSIYMTPTHAS